MIPLSPPIVLPLGYTWDGHPLSPPAAQVTLSALPQEPLHIGLTVEAPLYDDPPPPARPPGPCWGLWEHEVVELFLLGEDERYLEIELGPHGHHLVLLLHGVRNPVARELPLDYTVHRLAGGRWRGEARLPRALLPPGALRVNAYAIHGSAPHRQYAAWSPVPGPAPDFHRLSRFPPLPGSLP